MLCPYCGATLADGARLCTLCGRLLAPRQPGPPSSVPPTIPLPVPQEHPPPGPGYPPPHRSDPYGPFFDPGSLPPETAAAWRQHQFHATFSVLLLLLVHFLTFGMASPILLARKYTFLPRIRHDDFSTARAAGFLLIPFYNLYWVIVLCQRIVDRLTLQARLRDLPGAPSRGMSTALAIGWLISAIPYLGLLFWLPVHFALWPIYLAQLQSFCNRLALEAAPPDVRPVMLALERATRLRWIGWMIVVPCLLMVAVSLVVMLIAPPGPVSELVVGMLFFLAIAGAGGTLLYLGERGVPELHDQLESRAPSILAGYLRIDKNAAWSVVWIAIPFALTFALAGLTGLVGRTPPGEAWSSVACGAALGAGAAYAVWRALRLRQEIARLTTRP